MFAFGIIHISLWSFNPTTICSYGSCNSILTPFFLIHMIRGQVMWRDGYKFWERKDISDLGDMLGFILGLIYPILNFNMKLLCWQCNPILLVGVNHIFLWPFVPITNCSYDQLYRNIAERSLFLWLVSLKNNFALFYFNKKITHFDETLCLPL